MSDEKPFWSRIPSHLFGGKVRTATLGLCLLWVALWMLYLFLNQPDKPAEVPPSAVIISDTPYVPYVPPASTAPSATLPPTVTPDPSGTGTPPPVTATTVPSTPGAPTTTRTVPSAPAPTTTTTRQMPFDLQIPGLPSVNEQNDTSETGEPGQ
ncbi:hypothetical protein ACIBED_05915 [Rhodococcus coprophilus]|uniref:Uncharacterized protein n=1 Tax=Rhodococcus coprophilus TaxID=38310 RepID=A0A2X4UFT9_9NOCA|nr:hypothetical protein [Rhodococcus coprophilus]MBM7460193.1 hypothetical protein [Rhodococcus coprophilus]SQI38756.1 Uncharacterised protein [Rhodococcus coprophilus]